MTVFDPKTRRFFLQGTAGGLLALPFLPSLLPKGFAQAPAAKRFFALTMDHGFMPNSWFPANYRNPRDYAREYSAIDFPSTGPISYLIGNEFTRLRNKLLLFRGLDSILHEPQWPSHEEGWPLAGTRVRKNPVPNKSIDIVLSESSRVYPTAPAFRHISVGVGFKGNSWTVVNGAMKNPFRYEEPGALYRALFAHLKVDPAAGPDHSAIRNGDAIGFAYADYKRLRDSGSLSKEDTQVLEAHMQVMSDLGKRLGSPTLNAGMCTVPEATLFKDFGNNEAKNHDERYKQFFDLILLAVKCGLTNVVHISLPSSENSNPSGAEDARYRHLNTPNMTFDKTVHDYSHMWGDGDGGKKALATQAWLMKTVGRFMNTMDVIEDSTKGTTYLDNSIAMCVNNMSDGGSHLRYDLPVLLGGGLGGKILTGKFLDYTQNIKHSTNHGVDRQVGIDYQRLLVGILQAYGLTEQEYHQPNMPLGFGCDQRDGAIPASLSGAKRRIPLPGLLKI